MSLGCIFEFVQLFSFDVQKLVQKYFYHKKKTRKKKNSTMGGIKKYNQHKQLETARKRLFIWPYILRLWFDGSKTKCTTIDI